MDKLYKEVYYKEPAHVIMEAGKFQDLQSESAGWRPGRADGVGLLQDWLAQEARGANVLIQVQRQEKSQYPSLRAIRQEEFCLT